MLGREWAGVLASLANCQKKTGFPYKIMNHLEDSGKHREKRKKQVYVFYLHANILYYNSNN